MKAIYSATIRRSIIPLSLIFLMSGNFLNSQSGPAWWTDQGTAIWDGTTQENFAPLNVGQLKHVATQAKAYLDGIYPGIDWDTAYSGSGISNPFSTDAFNPLLATDNYSPANVGQLKAISYGFYKVLDAYNHDSTANISDFSGTSSYLHGFIVPWDSAILGEDSNVMNIGQLKLVFSFWPDLDVAENSGVGDGLADYWELSVFGSTAIHDDPQYDGEAGTGDGLTLLEEFQLGTSPLERDHPDLELILFRQ